MGEWVSWLFTRLLLFFFKKSFLFVYIKMVLYKKKKVLVYIDTNTLSSYQVSLWYRSQLCINTQDPLIVPSFFLTAKPSWYQYQSVSLYNEGLFFLMISKLVSLWIESLIPIPFEESLFLYESKTVSLLYVFIYRKKWFWPPVGCFAPFQ